MLNFQITGNSTLDFLIALCILACFIYMILGAFFETADKQRVVNAAKAFTARKERNRYKGDEAAELWDSVAQLDKNRSELRKEEQWKIPAVRRKNSARLTSPK